MTDGFRNFPPLFNYSDTQPKLIYQRTKVDDRNSRKYTKFVKSQLERDHKKGWRALLFAASHSEEYKNLHPFSKGFSVSQKTLHIRRGDGATLIANVYGSHGGIQPWGMLSQSILPLHTALQGMEWTFIENPAPGIFVAGGYHSVGGSISEDHVGLEVLQNNTVRILWESASPVLPHHEYQGKAVSNLCPYSSSRCPNTGHMAARRFLGVFLGIGFV